MRRAVGVTGQFGQTGSRDWPIAIVEMTAQRKPITMRLEQCGEMTGEDRAFAVAIGIEQPNRNGPTCEGHLDQGKDRRDSAAGCIKVERQRLGRQQEMAAGR